MFKKEDRLARARNRFPKGDPLYYQHVLRKDRLTEDSPPPESEGIDLQWFLEHPDGEDA